MACSEDPSACFEADVEMPEVFQSIRFQNCSADSDQYEWSFGDGTTSTDVNPVHAYSDTGLFDVQLLAISDFGGSSNFIIQQIRIYNPSEKFIGNYQAKLNQIDYLLQIKAGNTTSSLLFFLDGTLFCNAQCQQSEIVVNQQKFWTNEFDYIIYGVGALSENQIELDFLLHDNAGNEYLLSLLAERLNL